MLGWDSLVIIDSFPQLFDTVFSVPYVLILELPKNLLEAGFNEPATETVTQDNVIDIIPPRDYADSRGQLNS